MIKAQKLNFGAQIVLKDYLLRKKNSTVIKGMKM